MREKRFKIKRTFQLGRKREIGKDRVKRITQQMRKTDRQLKRENRKIMKRKIQVEEKKRNREKF